MSENDEAPNTYIELVNQMTGKCTSLKALVFQGYIDESGTSSETMNTIVKFDDKAGKCN